MPRKPSDFEDHPISFPDAVSLGYNRAVCTHVVDGDTFDVFIDLGFLQYAYETIRLYDIDTPEIYRPKTEEERERGHAAKARVEELILGKSILIQSYKDQETFGRFVAKILFSHESVSGALFEYRDLDGNQWYDLAGTLKNEGFEKQ